MKIRATVCELTNNEAQLEADWERLCEHTKAHRSEFVLLPEMPFCGWLARSRPRDEEALLRASELHNAWIQRIPELGARWVASSRPVVDEGRARNQGFVWGDTEGVQDVHSKRYLPQEESFWEAEWYEQGRDGFECYRDRGLTLGFAICTELWFFEHAREYGKNGAQLLLSPRATLMSSREKWLAGGRAQAAVSGAYCLSSNYSGRVEPSGSSTDEWAGYGWIIDPEEGEVLGKTSSEEPFITRELDLARADAAKSSYPRYVT